jgi:peptide/nickel transport system ATP-binding protein
VNVYTVTISAERTRLVSIEGFALGENQITVLFGESGIGKSLLAKSIYGILDPDILRVTVNGRSFRDYRSDDEVRDRQMNGFFVFQEPSSHLNPMLRIEDQLREGTLAGTQYERGILEDLWGDPGGRGFETLLPVYPKPHRPSGGEKQRVLLAMAFKKIDRMIASDEPGRRTLFVFDEPTGSLDNRYRDIVLSMLLERFRRKPFTVLLITHDYSMISVLNAFARQSPRSIAFRELVRASKGLEVREFLPETYIQWLRDQLRQRQPSAASTAEPVLEIENNTTVFGYRLTITRDPGGNAPCPLIVYPGTLTYLKAPSGTGKTTIVKMICGLIDAEAFSMRLGGMNLNASTSRRLWRHRIWGKKIALVFQHADEALNPRATVREVFQGLPPRGRVPDATIQGTLQQLFDEPITGAFLGRRVSSLSGGQKQRLNLLRSLFLDTDLLIVDEPLNGLDFASATKVVAMIRERQRRGKSVLIISHNEEMFDTQVTPDRVYYLHAAPVSEVTG